MFKFSRNSMAAIVTVSIGSLTTAIGLLAHYLPVELWLLALPLGVFGSFIFAVAFSEMEY